MIYSEVLSTQHNVTTIDNTTCFTQVLLKLSLNPLMLGQEIIIMNEYYPTRSSTFHQYKPHKMMVVHPKFIRSQKIEILIVFCTEATIC